MRTYEGYRRFKGAWRPSAAQRRVLDGLAAGRSNPQIAEELGLSVETVKWHVGQLLGETGCADRTAMAAWWQGRRPSGPPLAPLLAALALVGVLATVAAMPAVRAQLGRLVCYVPGVGVRSCEAPGLVAPGPVSVSRDSKTLTIHSLYSAEGQTHVRLEITGFPDLELTGDPAIDRQRLQADDGNAGVLQETRIGLRDEEGREYSHLPIPVPMGFGGPTAIPVGATRVPQPFTAEAVFEPLRPEVRAAEIVIEAPEPIGSWSVRVPVVPAGRDGLPAARAGGAGVTLHGITVDVAGATAENGQFAVRVRGRSAAPWGPVQALGGERPGRRLILRDERGRQYEERRSPPRAVQPDPGVFVDDLVFPPLAPDAGAVELLLPFVTVQESVGEARLTVPIGEARVGDRIPLETELRLGRYPVRVTGAEVVEQHGQRKLALMLDLGDWHEGRKLVRPARIVVPNGGRGFEGQFSSAGTAQWTRLQIPLIDDPPEEITVVFRDAHVAVEGPWRLPLPPP